MAKLRIGTSCWSARTGGTTYPKLHGTRDADIAVVGGGITGCLTAYAFASAGFSVVVLEAGRIGRGSTIASTALLMQEPDVDFRDLAARYGPRQTSAIWSQSTDAVRGLTTLIRRLRIGAALEDVGSIYWTTQAPVARDLQRELARRKQAGFGGRWLDPPALKRQIGVDGAGGILSAGNAQFDPYRACLGIARRLPANHVSVFERTPVRRLRGSPEGVTIDVDDGGVRAAWAVIATGYATPEFKPLAGRFRMSKTYVIATAPIDRRTHRNLGLGAMWWDTETPYHYSRWTPDRRILFGGRDLPQRSGRARPALLAEQTARLQSDLISLYPSLEHTPIDFAWEGLFATTRDGLPYIGTHRHYPRQLFALGYGGNGMTFGFLAAEVLVRTVLNRATDVDRFFGFARMR
jgi:glycine/D-amino acid oxidase-like deaminating enzyme